MTETVQKTKHSPRLETIKMVENSLKNMDESVITIAGLKKILPKQVNHNTLVTILEYLEESRKIYVGIRGITWTYNNSPEMKKALAEGTTVTPEFFQKIIDGINKEEKHKETHDKDKIIRKSHEEREGTKKNKAEINN